MEKINIKKMTSYYDYFELNGKNFMKKIYNKIYFYFFCFKPFLEKLMYLYLKIQILD